MASRRRALPARRAQGQAPLTAPYRSMPHQGRRDYRRTGRRYRWACRLWRHAPPLHFAAFAAFTQASTLPLPSREGLTGIPLAIVSRAHDKAAEAKIRAVFELAEGVDAIVTPRFSRSLA